MILLQPPVVGGGVRTCDLESGSGRVVVLMMAPGEVGSVTPSHGPFGGESAQVDRISQSLLLNFCPLLTLEGQRALEVAGLGEAAHGAEVGQGLVLVLVLVLGAGDHESARAALDPLRLTG